MKVFVRDLVVKAIEALYLMEGSVFIEANLFKSGEYLQGSRANWDYVLDQYPGYADYFIFGQSLIALSDRHDTWLYDQPLVRFLVNILEVIYK